MMIVQLICTCLPCLFRYHTLDLCQPRKCSHRLLGSSPTYIKKKTQYIKLNWNISKNTMSEICYSSTMSRPEIFVTFSTPKKKAGDKSSNETRGSKETDVGPTICCSRMCEIMQMLIKSEMYIITHIFEDL